MEQYIKKSDIVAEIERLKSAAETMLTGKTDLSYWKVQKHLCKRLLSFLDTLEVKKVSDIWYDARKTLPEDGIEQIICIKEDGLSVSSVGKIVNGTTKWAYLNKLVNFSSIEAFKEVDLEKEFDSFLNDIEGVPPMWHSEEQIEWGKDIAHHFFELGLKAQKEK